VPEQLIPLCQYYNEKRQKPSYIFFIESYLSKSQMILGEGADFDWVPLNKTSGYQLTENTAKSLDILKQRLKI